MVTGISRERDESYHHPKRNPKMARPKANRGVKKIGLKETMSYIEERHYIKANNQKSDESLARILARFGNKLHK